MPVIEINWKPPPKQLRVFALLQAVFFAFVAWGIAARSESSAAAVILLGLSLLAGLLGVIWPRTIHPIYVVWMAAVLPIGWLVSHLLLASLFYLVMTPVGIIMRLCGYDPMHRRFDREATTYWIPRDEAKGTDRYFKQY